MTSLFSYLITILAVIFWFFRIAVAYFATVGEAFICEPMNLQFEILILFLTVPCFVLILKRNLIGAAIYFSIYALYFGTAVYNTVQNLTMIEDGIGMVSGMNFFVAILGIIIPLLTFLDILVNKNRLSVSKDREADWFYKNEKFDRDFDERADRNQYKIK